MAELPKVLITDDDEDMLLLLSTQIQRAGFEVVIARDGEQAIEQNRLHEPTIAILDWMMPKLDGLNACRIIRQENKRVYIIILSAINTDEQKAEALEAGANDYQTKPLRGNKLVNLLKEILQA